MELLIIVLVAKLCGALIAFNYYRALSSEDKSQVLKAFRAPLIIIPIVGVYGGMLMMIAAESSRMPILSFIGAAIMLAAGVVISVAIWRSNKWVSMGVPMGMTIGRALFMM
ncbi:hypothetical protein H0266_02485 [Halobacillus locisalis]|uniref:Uncharacterized protein n=1 Tax=Halobacillus locisalis TaxID=220753 RepID=A0A838CPH7_9BACI|nr:hypothetical protein [Halobacillus locisalis]MBA2173758.1 hypothetical protein [Halobacillus locisalis]